MSNRYVLRRPGGSPATLKSMGRNPGKLTPGAVTSGKSSSTGKSSTKSALQEVGKVVKPSNPRDGRYSATSSSSSRPSNSSSSSGVWPGSDVRKQSSSGTGKASGKKSAKSNPPVVRQSPSRSSEKPDARIRSQASDRAQAKASLVSRSRSDDSQATVELRKKHTSSTASPYKSRRAEIAVKAADLSDSDSSSRVWLSDTSSSSSVIDSSDSSSVIDSSDSSSSTQSSSIGARAIRLFASTAPQVRDYSAARWTRLVAQGHDLLVTDLVKPGAINAVQGSIAERTKEPVYVAHISLANGKIAIQMLRRAASEQVRDEVARVKKLPPGTTREQLLRNAINKKALEAGATKTMPLDAGDWKDSRLRKAFSSSAQFRTFLSRIESDVRRSVFDATDFAPQGILAVIHQLDRHDKLGEEGLYRQGGSISEIEDAASKIASGDLSVVQGSMDEKLLASVLKKLVRDFPGELIPHAGQLELLKVESATGGKPAKKIDAIKAGLANMPLANQAVLDAILRHMRKVSDRSKENRMSPENLAIVLAPNLFPTASTATRVSLVKFMIENVASLNPAPVPMPLGYPLERIEAGMNAAIKLVRDEFKGQPYYSALMRGRTQGSMPFKASEIRNKALMDREYQAGNVTGYFRQVLPALKDDQHARCELLDLAFQYAREEYLEQFSGKLDAKQAGHVLDTLMDTKLDDAEKADQVGRILDPDAVSQCRLFLQKIRELAAAIAEWRFDSLPANDTLRTDRDETLETFTMQALSNFHHAPFLMLGFTADQLCLSRFGNSAQFDDPVQQNKVQGETRRYRTKVQGAAIDIVNKVDQYFR